MHVIVPITLTDENLLDYRVKLDPYTEWDNTTVYRRGRRVIVKSGINKVYESVYPNVSRFPPNHVDDEQPAWQLVRPLNVWSMLSAVPDQRTKNRDEVFVKIRPNARVNAVGLHGVEANTVVVKVFDAAGTLVEERAVDLVYSTRVDPVTLVTEYGSYSEAVISALPEHPEGAIEVQLLRPGGWVFCDTMTFGEYKELGITKPNLNVSAIDTSLKQISSLGLVSVQEKDIGRSIRSSLTVPWEQIDYSHRTLSDLRATPVTWASTGTVPLSIVYGMYRDFELWLESSALAKCDLDVLPILYEPTTPPATEPGASVFLTSRPYPVSVQDDHLTPSLANGGVNSLSLRLAELVTNSLDNFIPVAPRLASLNLRLIVKKINYEVEAVAPSLVSLSALDLRAVLKTVAIPEEFISINTPSVSAINLRHILISHEVTPENISTSSALISQGGIDLKFVMRYADAGVEGLSPAAVGITNITLVAV